MIPFSPPHIDQKIIDEVTDTLRSGWITTGPKTKRFEKEISSFTGAPATLCLNSATAGLEVMLNWFGVGPGDEVIVPAYTYCATANVVVHLGARPVFVDVNADDFNLDIRKVARAITEKTKVIMPVDFGGLPCDYESLINLINQQDILKLFRPAHPNQHTLGRIMILSDAAHSFGASVKTVKTGMLCDVSVFSFHAVKNLTTAEGGAISLNLPEPFSNDDIYKKLCISTLHGQNKDALAKTQKGNWRYDVVEAGFKCNMTDIAAAIGLVELSRYTSEILPRRRQICEQYQTFFSNYSWAELPVFRKGEAISSYHLYALRIKGITEEQRDRIIQRIFDQDVSVNVHFIPVPQTSFYRSLGYRMEDYPVAGDLFSREISLPVFYDLNEKQVQLVCNAVNTAVSELLKL